jgi:hypothetical protein
MTATTRTPLACPLHGGNAHPDGSCHDERDRPLCADGVAFCQVHTEREAMPAVTVDPASKLRICEGCAGELVADAAETQRRLALYGELERVALAAGDVARAEREGRGS